MLLGAHHPLEAMRLSHANVGHSRAVQVTLCSACSIDWICFSSIAIQLGYWPVMPCASCSQTKRANVSLYFTGLPSLSPGKIHTISVRELLFSMLPHLELRTFYIVGASGAWALGSSLIALSCSAVHSSITFDVHFWVFSLLMFFVCCIAFIFYSAVLLIQTNWSLYVKNFRLFLNITQPPSASFRVFLCQGSPESL